MESKISVFLQMVEYTEPHCNVPTGNYLNKINN